ncbi:MAG: hypothetical protein M3Z22_06965 [Verrucomicrobiota bacterium]|nr:hypothetical protein [Verrucomicrobiota bacterium]
MSALAQGAVFDLSSRTKLRITGSDRLRYLNGQITNDLRKATAGRKVQACVLSAKGKINAEIFAVVDGESFLIDSDCGMREQLTARLERYIIADDVQIADATEEMALFHVVGGDVSMTPAGCADAHAKRFGCEGIDLWLKRADGEVALQALAAQWPLCDDQCADTLRIERGIPRWGRELTDEIIPNEAGLEASVIDYAKGCYIGQEVISRIKMSGQTNKRLCGFVCHPGSSLKPGARLRTTAGEAREVGWITSVTESARLRQTIALGYVKRGSQEVGTQLAAVADSGTVTVTIVPLPFL